MRRITENTNLHLWTGNVTQPEQDSTISNLTDNTTIEQLVVNLIDDFQCTNPLRKPLGQPNAFLGTYLILCDPSRAYRRYSSKSLSIKSTSTFSPLILRPWVVVRVFINPSKHARLGDLPDCAAKPFVLLRIVVLQSYL